MILYQAFMCALLLMLGTVQLNNEMEGWRNDSVLHTLSLDMWRLAEEYQHQNDINAGSFYPQSYCGKSNEVHRFRCSNYLKKAIH
jgi:hypothetical protein